MEGAASQEWLWPGRIFFDGLQHRWSKWVLDFSATDQVDLMDRVGRWFEDRSEAADTPDDGGGVPGWTWLALLGAAVVGVWGLGFRRGGLRGATPESAAYLALLRSARRAGVVGRRPVTPLHLVDRIRDASPPAASASGRLVELYLRARFAGRPLDRSEARELRDALAVARRALG